MGAERLNDLISLYISYKIPSIRDEVIRKYMKIDFTRL